MTCATSFATMRATLAGYAERGTMQTSKSLWLIAALTLALPLLGNPQSGQQEPLGDVARQLREQKPKAAKPAKVYTNDDIPATTPLPAPSAEPDSGKPAENGKANDVAKAASPITAAEKPAPESTAPEPAVKDREYWQAKFKSARETLARAKEVEQLSEDELNLLQIQEARDFSAAATLDTAAKDELDKKIRDKQSEVEAKKAVTEAAQKALDDLERAFQESGAPEEWSVTESAPAPEYGPPPIEPAVPPSPTEGGRTLP